MAKREREITLVVGLYEMRVNPKTDPELQEVICEVERLGGWDQFKKALSTENHEASN
jgi:hypothetical protein